MAEHRRGHGALYDAVNHGRLDIGRLRGAAVTARGGRPAGASRGREQLTAAGAAASPERLFCHVYGRGKGRRK